MVNRPGLDFSFSGLKTHALVTLQAHGEDAQTKADIACAFELAMVDTLTIKCQRALAQTGHKRLVVAGGVSANSALRKRLATMAAQEGVDMFYPRLEFCTDNAAMIAYAGLLRLQRGEHEELNFHVYPRWPLSDLDNDGS